MEQYEKIQQLLKKEPGTKERVPIFPPTVIQAVFDGKTGASLEAILAQFNSVFVQFQGTAKDTRILIPADMRRPGLIITYVNAEGETVSERASLHGQADDEHWALDVNWSRIDELSLSGDIAVSARGTWIINGEDTGIKAVGPKGENGITPWLKEIDNKLHYSYDNVKWTPCSDPLSAQFRNHNNRIQISYDKGKTWKDISDPVATYVRFAATSSTGQDGSIGKLQYSHDKATWHDLSPEFRNYLRIQGYVATHGELPTGVPVGTIYGVGPTYKVDDITNSNPMYQIFVWNGTDWVNNGTFTSISAGIVQETGNSETEVMSQKAVSDELEKVNLKSENTIDSIGGDFNISDENGNVISSFDKGHIKTKNFDSAKTSFLEDGANGDFSVADENNNVLMIIHEGHIKTKNFDSKNNLPLNGSDVDFSISDEDNNVLVEFSNGHIRTKKFNSATYKDSSDVLFDNTSLIYQEQNNPFGKESNKYFIRSAKLMLGDDVQPLIIVAGQSNADGRINYTFAPSWLSSNDYKIDNYKVWDIKTNSFQTYNVKGMTGNSGYFDTAEKNKYSFDVFFAKKFLENNPTKTLYMIRQTVGGIGMQTQPTTPPMNWTWQPDTDKIVEGCQSMCLSLQTKLFDGLNFAKINGIKLLPIAILWHQGENEVDSGNVSYAKQNLSNLISWIRGLFKAPHLPFINAEIAKTHIGYDKVNEIFSELNKVDDYMATVDMSNNTTLLDDGYVAHYDADAIEYMGEQMYNEYKKLN